MIICKILFSFLILMVNYETMTVLELKEYLRKQKLPVSGNKSELINRLKSKIQIPENVIDKKLYKDTIAKIKKRVKVWPSAYASGQVVKEYKLAGGRYKNNNDESNLSRWYKEEWVNVCKRKNDGTFEKCGRKQSTTKNYPYCRPLKKINESTPMTVNEIKKKYGEKKLNELCKKKHNQGLPQKSKPTRISKD